MVTPTGGNQGRVLPQWLATTDPEALRGTQRLRTVDRNLIVGLDRRRGVFQVWGPSLSSGGWVPICDCQDDEGRPFRGFVPWDLIAAALIRAREGELSADIVERHNERLYADEDRRVDERTADGAEFYARAVAGEREGWGRFAAEDVEAAYLRQVLGEKPEAQGVVHSLPGK